jgi:hypothetical protein
MKLIPVSEDAWSRNRGGESSEFVFSRAGFCSQEKKWKSEEIGKWEIGGSS